MAFVLVQHLAPDHKSILVDLIRRYTRMQVFEVEDGMPVRINCTYIIPPNRDMAYMHGTLQLLEPSSPRGRRLPIDFFFSTLAQDQRERAIGIVLSGTGSDGTQGVRAIKSQGGMVMAQTPQSTEYDGMPRSAIATGLVDYEIAAADMPAQLMAYAVHAFGKPRQPNTVAAPLTESAIKKVFVMLRSQTGHDFSQYKPSTIHRRIERRMAVAQIDALDSYVRYLQQTPAEVEALFRDLLIGVTNFFRDTDAFAALETEVIPRLFENRAAGTRAVLDTLVSQSTEVQTTEGHWYTLRIQPYRTTENVIEGAVISFIDIAEIVRSREALAKANDLLRLAVVVRDAFDAITVQDLGGRTIAWNPGAVWLYGWSEAEALQMNVRDRIPAALQDKAIDRLRQLSLAEVLEPYPTQRLSKDGRVINVSLTSTALLDDAGKMYAIATTERAGVPAKLTPS